MGCFVCSKTASEQEIFLTELWINSKICQTSPEEYIEYLNITIEESLKNSHSNDNRNEIFERILEKIIEKYLSSDINYEVFDKIKGHILMENKKYDKGYYVFFALVFLIDSNKKEKQKMLIDVHLIIQKIKKNLKEISLKTKKSFFKNILIMYIDLVSFCTVGYFLKQILNKKNDEYFDKYDKVLDAFRIKNREQLVLEFLGSSDNFDMLHFLEIHDSDLEHQNIRKALIEMHYGEDGLNLVKPNKDHKKIVK